MKIDERNKAKKVGMNAELKCRDKNEGECRRGQTNADTRGHGFVQEVAESKAS